jgi:serine protease Do
MSTRKSSIFYGTLIGLSSLVVGMVLASRLELTPASFARTAPLTMPAVNSAPLTGALDASTFRTIAHEESPAVVSIIVSGKQTAPEVNDFFGFQLPFGSGQNGPNGQNRRGGRGGGTPTEQPFRGAGSGFIIDGKAGYILTNNHVVENADEITVMLSNAKYEDEEGLQAKVVGRDRLTDSALIQLTETPKTPLPEVKFGDSHQIAPGDWVMAIGNPFQLSSTVTVGVVSAVGRVSQELNPMTGRDLEYIQTDAAINKGNSGGPLMNIRGEVIGMNTAIYSQGGIEGNIGIGFAVPIDTVREVLPQLRSGHVVRGRIGVRLRGTPLTTTEAKDFGLPSTAGALVQIVDPDGPAKTAGIRPGDVVVEYNGKPVKTNPELVSAVSATAPGTSTPIKVIRAGKPVSLTVKVEELPVDTEQPLARATERPRPEPAQPTDTGFGMTVEPLTGGSARQAGVPAGKGGAIVSDVSPLSAAFRGGMAPGDVILSVNDKDVTSVSEVTKALETVQAGHTARVLVWRPQDHSEQYLTLRKR